MKTLVLLAVLLAGTMSVSATPYVTATYFDYGDGYQFDFVVHMDNPTYGEGNDWGLESTIFSNALSPTGWNAFVDFRRIQWGSTYPQYNITAGGSMAGFAASAATVPSTLDYFIATTGPVTTYLGTVTPTPIPEPCSLLALVGGLGVVGMHFIRQKKSR